MREKLPKEDKVPKELEPLIIQKTCDICGKTMASLVFTEHRENCLKKQIAETEHRLNAIEKRLDEREREEQEKLSKIEKTNDEETNVEESNEELAKRLVKIHELYKILKALKQLKLYSPQLIDSLSYEELTELVETKRRESRLKLMLEAHENEELLNQSLEEYREEIQND